MCGWIVVSCMYKLICVDEQALKRFCSRVGGVCRKECPAFVDARGALQLLLGMGTLPRACSWPNNPVSSGRGWMSKPAHEQMFFPVVVSYEVQIYTQMMKRINIFRKTACLVCIFFQSLEKHQAHCLSDRSCLDSLSAPFSSEKSIALIKGFPTCWPRYGKTEALEVEG